MSNSQCSSGCESGWTSYFDEPTLSLSRFETPYAYPEGNAAIVEKEEEEENQSMISDASSGPRYYYPDDQELCTYMEMNSKNETSQGVGRQSYLDDTATSSIVSSINQRNTPLAMSKAAEKSLMDFSNGFDQSTHFRGKPAIYDSFLQSSLNLSEKKYTSRRRR